MSSPLPMPAPPTNLAEASASLQALWDYTQPALDHMLRSPTNDPTEVPAIDASYYIWISTALYNYWTCSRRPASSSYETVPSVAQELLLGAPQDAHALIRYILPTYTRYATGTAVLHRMLNYTNRFYVKAELDNGYGWLGWREIPSQDQNKAGTKWREVVKANFAELRTTELKKWGWEEGDPEEVLAQAEACAEAASELDRTVPLASLAHRRFRTEVLEPLLKVSGAGAGTKQSQEPEGRLGDAVAELLESTTSDGLEERAQLAQDMARMLRMCGIQPDHPVRKRLDRDGYTGAVAHHAPTAT
ncbi:hypothetical protein EVG20_g4406 [Dentipellis fragilis]|uniref:Uncharacterized protein n=1 Tax=Dentipellis fragilis TaxID=205917 RepID=A0A4Y9YVS3_9AGAM|nr:hypothetical protein EVG20_g4406 [Dentipellis fragilis]